MTKSQWELHGVVTQISTILRAATGIMTPYMANVAVVWVWLTVFLCIVRKRAHHHRIMLPWSHCHRHFLRWTQAVTPSCNSTYTYNAYWSDHPLCDPPCSVLHVVLGWYYNLLLWTPYCRYINILGSGWDWYQTSAIAYITQAHTYVFTLKNYWRHICNYWVHILHICNSSFTYL